MMRGTSLRAQHDLAVLLHQPNVRRMMQSIDVNQWQDWLTYMSMVPNAEERADWRTAKVCQTFVNMWRGKDDEAHPIEDFLVKFGDQVEGFFDPRPFPKKALTAEEVVEQTEQNIRTWMAGHNRVTNEGQNG